MAAKIVVLVLLAGIVAALLSAGVFLVKDPSRSRRMVWALTLRVALSIALIAFLAVAYLAGWIHPHGLGG
ncbi:MAG: DUF2909 domain-containing protein [Gammaproteobacteria bacterium]|nr:DUF2909 domain-containing protein [Gammaproteobacteria bacterium]